MVQRSDFSVRLVAERLGPGVCVPPARQGDVWKALIDGVFEAQPSVWHREILEPQASQALARPWRAVEQVRAQLERCDARHWRG